MSEADWSSQKPTEVEALVELMFLVASADGEFSLTERRQFLDTARSLSQSELDSTSLLAIIERAEKRLGVDGLESRLSVLADSLGDELGRRLAFGLCTKVALGEGDCEPAERRMLDRIATALGISEQDDEEIAHSVRMSQRPTS